MRLARVLAGGWIAGALVVVALDVAARAAVEKRTERPAAPLTAAAEPAGKVLIPVAGIEARDLRDTFGDARSSGRTHKAIDIFAPKGTPVLAAVDGTVRKLFTSRAGGLTVYQFDEGSARLYYYAHLDRYRDGLAEGMRLRRGEVIGYVGTSGNVGASTPHLHFSIERLPPGREWWKGEPLNPYPILAGR